MVCLCVWCGLVAAPGAPPAWGVVCAWGVLVGHTTLLCHLKHPQNTNRAQNSLIYMYPGRIAPVLSHPSEILVESHC